MSFLSMPVVACSACVNGHTFPLGMERCEGDIAKTARFEHAAQCSGVRPKPVCRVVAFFGRRIESKRWNVDIEHGTVSLDDCEATWRCHVSKFFKSEHWMTQMVKDAEEKHDVKLADALAAQIVDVDIDVFNVQPERFARKFERLRVSPASAAPAPMIGGDNARGTAPLRFKAPRTVPGADIKDALAFKTRWNAKSRTVNARHRIVHSGRDD